MKAQSLAIHAKTLQENRPEAEILLRICTVANSINSISRRFVLIPQKDEDADPHARQDRLCLWIIVASLLKETVKVLNSRHDGLGWKLAALGEQAGVTFPPSMSLQALKTLLVKDSPFIKSCGAIRDRFAFHVDREPMLDWLATRPANKVIGIVSQLGELQSDVVFDAGTFAVFHAVEALMIDDFDKTVSEVVLAMPFLVEAIARGFIASKKLQITHIARSEEDIVFGHEVGYVFSTESGKGGA